jgi:hypothetical protein
MQNAGALGPRTVVVRQSQMGSHPRSVVWRAQVVIGTEFGNERYPLVIIGNVISRWLREQRFSCPPKITSRKQL